jgi:hypothetical protein
VYIYNEKDMWADLPTHVQENDDPSKHFTCNQKKFRIKHLLAKDTRN